MESTVFHMPKVVSFEVLSSGQHNPLIGSNLTLSTLEHFIDMVEALNLFLGKSTIILVDLNAGIVHLHNLQSQAVAELLTSFGLVNLLSHFIQ